MQNILTSAGMLRTLGGIVGNAASGIVNQAASLVDVRPKYQQIGKFAMKGASYESFDSSGLFSGLGFGSGSSSSSTGVSGDSSGYFGGMGQIGSGLGSFGVSGGSDASGSGISSYLPSGQSVGAGAGVFFVISAILALFPVALILNQMIFMPLALRIGIAIFVYSTCVVNPFLAIPIYLYYIVRMMINYYSKEIYLLFPFFGFWPLRLRQPTDGSVTTFFTWPFSYLDPDMSKERHVDQRTEYEAGAKIYAQSLVDTLRLTGDSIQKLGITSLRDKVIQGLMTPLRAQEIAAQKMNAMAAAAAVATAGAAGAAGATGATAATTATSTST